ncbi:FAD-dependent oxidoreductase [Bosea sp. (in: a-proteobacteria)]|uniref:FAD-dependent oxidoreductase n=1 Tax=Bosea sp. (in: a-proteobacteria) TaxID=1871050 RepID=UPI003F706BFA
MGSMEGEGGRLFFQAETFDTQKLDRRRPSSRVVVEPAQELPVHTECDVLVVGGGPAGTAAAVAAARLGADVVLLERYNHLGGLSTGGLVIWIDRMTDWNGTHVIRGFAEELLSRLTRDMIAGPSPAEWGSKDPERVAHWALRTAAFNGTVTHSPTLDPEWLKAESLAMVLEAGVHPIFHAWGARPLLEGNRVTGCAFESKEGRRAVLAKVTIDATGDGDLYARAGSGFDTEVDTRDIHGCMNTAWLFGGVDMQAFLRFRGETPEQFSQFMARGREAMRFFEKPVVSWRDDVAVFMGPRLAGYSALKVEDLSEVEIRSHQLMVEHLAFYRAHAPGFSNAFLMLSAPQLGVRHGRRLVGQGKLTREAWDGRIAADEIGVSPSLSPKFANVSVPYGAIVPREVEGLLAPGRHLSCDATSHSFMREIPQCWLTGHAAGVAAAIAADRGLRLAEVPVAEMRVKLAAQGAFLSEAREMAES